MRIGNVEASLLSGFHRPVPAMACSIPWPGRSVHGASHTPTLARGRVRPQARGAPPPTSDPTRRRLTRSATGRVG